MRIFAELGGGDWIVSKRLSDKAFARVLERFRVIPKTPSERLRILGPQGRVGSIPTLGTSLTHVRSAADAGIRLAASASRSRARAAPAPVRRIEMDRFQEVPVPPEICRRESRAAGSE
jgi:hypothetical protein